MKFFIQTFGCKVNLYESQWLTDYLTGLGYEYDKELEKADIIIINSCTVTSQGDSRAVSFLKKAKKQAPDAVTVMTGCFPQARGAEDIDADIVTGTVNRHRIPELISEYLARHEKICAVQPLSEARDFEDMICSSFHGHTRAFVKIQDGCNQFCTYCAIPYARGRCRSKTPEAIKRELEAIAGNGFREVVFSGINLAFWGVEWGLSLRDAVKIAAETTGIERIRLSSLEPERLTDEDISYFASLDKFCPQFHLSLQSGCDRTLKAMHRKYSTAEYAALAKKIKTALPDAALTTDVMVGFPGETEEDFEESLNFVKSIGFAKVHVFRYSRRKGTPADKMPGQVAERIKTERFHKMTAVCEKNAENFHKSLVGKTFPVLFEKQKSPNIVHGHAPNGVVIKISEKNPKKGLRNSIFYVTIVSGDDNCCYGVFADRG